MPLVIDNPREIESVYAHQYENLARNFASLVPKRIGLLAEIGCGKGQLTVPLATLLPNHRFTLVDAFAGAYSGTESRLKRALSEAKLKSRVKVHMGDYLDWLCEEFSDKYVGVLSSEFLPEIDSYELSMFLSECYRVLRPGGLTVHSSLSPSPRNSRQRLLVEADTKPIWTKTPPKEWFSPNPVVVVSKLRRTGFREFTLRGSRAILSSEPAQRRNSLGAGTSGVHFGRSTRPAWCERVWNSRIG